VRGANSDGIGVDFSFRWIPEKSDEGQIYLSLAYHVLPNVQLGGDYRPLSDDFGVLATWRAIPETDRRPAVIFGTANDDFGDTNSQSVYGTVSKALPEWRGVRASPYTGVVYIWELEDVELLGGLHLRYRNTSALVQYSGTDTHLTLSHSFRQHTFSFVWFAFDQPGLAYSLSF
jgi:hypothetical protein